jgi:chitosanase
MPIAFVGANSVLNSTSGSSTAVPMPTATAAGNLLFVLLANVGNSPVPTAPAGWTLVSSFSPGTTLTTYLYRKTAVAGDNALTATWTWSSAGRNLGIALAYSGVDASVNTTTAQVWTHDVANAPIVAPSIGTSGGDWLATLAVGRENPGTATTKDWTIVGGDLERIDVATGGAATDIKISAAWFDSGTAAGSSARTVNVTPLQQQSHVWSILLPLPVSESVGGNPWTHMGFGAGFAGAITGALSAGADASLTTAQTFTRTATEPSGATVSSREWKIVSGPLGTGQVIGTAAALSWKPGSSAAGSNDIRNPTFQELAYEMTSTAENSTLDWTTAYGYIEDIGDNRGYTAGLVGFTSGTGDMLQLVQLYAAEKPANNTLAPYIPQLQECAAIGFGTGASAAASSKLGTPYINAWKAAASGDPIFRKVQRDYRKSMYWDDALVQALADGMGPLGLAIYYDVLVNHGVGTDSESFGGILSYVRANNTKPSSGGSMTTWLLAVINRRDTILKGWGDDQSVNGRVAMHKSLVNGGTVGGTTVAANPNLVAPIKFSCYGDVYTISTRPDPAADALLGSYLLRYTATGVGTSDVTVTVA